MREEKSSATTDNTGQCTFSINVGDVVKATKYQAQFDGDSNHLLSTSELINVNVLKDPTKINPTVALVSNDYNVTTDDEVVLTTTVTDENNNPLNDITVSFYQNSLLVGESTTTSTGKASITLPITATQEGTFSYNATTTQKEITDTTTGEKKIYSSVTSEPISITVYAVDTVLTLTSSTTSLPIGSGSVTFTVLLKDTEGNLLVNKDVIIHQGGSDLATITTDSNGQGTYTQNNIATVSGSWEYYATFAGKNLYKASNSESITVSVTKLDASISINVNSTNFMVPTTNSLVISGNLNSNGTGLGNQQVTVYQNDGERATTTTDSNGNYSFTLPVTATTDATWKYYVTYVGNSTYNGKNSESKTVTTTLQTYDTSLTINASSTHFYVPTSDSVVISGRLSSGLSGQALVLYRNGSVAATTNTGSNGNYSFSLPVTATTSATWNLYVHYGGSSPYNPSNSGTISVYTEVQNYSTSLTINANSTNFEMHSGSSLVISGKLNSSVSPGVQSLTVYQNNSVAANITTDSNGNYSFTQAVTASQGGTWTYYVHFGGSSPYNASNSDTINVTVYDSYPTSFSNLPSSLSKGNRINPILLDYAGNPLVGEHVELTLTLKSTGQSQTWSNNTDSTGGIIINDSQDGLLLNYTFTDTLIVKVSYAGRTGHNSCSVTKEIPYNGG